MTIKFTYKNKAKSSNLEAIVLFTDEKFQTKNLKNFISKNEASYVEKTLKNRKINKENIISFNLNEKTRIILISLKNELTDSLKRPSKNGTLQKSTPTN